MYEFPSDDGEIGPFVSNEIRWLKYKLCPLKSCFCAICFDLDKVYLADILCIHCIVLLSKLVHLGNKSFV